jgi:hypothetical protein
MVGSGATNMVKRRWGKNIVAHVRAAAIVAPRGLGLAPPPPPPPSLRPKNARTSLLASSLEEISSPPFSAAVFFTPRDMPTAPGGPAGCSGWRCNVDRVAPGSRGRARVVGCGKEWVPPGGNWREEDAERRGREGWGGRRGEKSETAE